MTHPLAFHALDSSRRGAIETRENASGSFLPPRVNHDVAVLMFSARKAPAWTFTSEDARAAVDARAQFVDFLRSVGSGDDFVARAELIFGELLGNVVRYAPGPVDISLDLEAESSTLHVIDSGPPFSLGATRLPDDELSELGRGLFIVQQLAANVRAEYIPNYGNHISVTL